MFFMNHGRYGLLLLFLILFLLVRCREKENPLEDALAKCGNNRLELMKVIDHYSRYKQDSLKLKAAVFLISNMPGHHFFDGDLLRHYHDSIMQEKQISYFTRKTGEVLLGQSALVKRTSDTINDNTVITSAYLVRHIDVSFELKERLPWLKDVSFDDFLNYVLPYRVDDEVLDSWRDSMIISDRDIWRIMNNTRGTMADVENGMRSFFTQPGMSNDSVFHYLGKKFILGCLERSNLEVFKLRVMGIPAAVDYIPFYANRNGFHGWVQRFVPEEKNIKLDLADNRKGAKILRRTFARNEIPVPAKGELIPALFTDPFNKDVTSAYLKTSDLTINTNACVSVCPNHVYLAVFNELEWRPIWWAENRKSKAIFKDMGRGIVYVPVYYVGNLMKHLSCPFILDHAGRIRELIPDTVSLQKMFLTRKYPRNNRVTDLAKSLEGIRMEVANSPGFENAGTVFRIDTVQNLEYFKSNIDLSGKFRYARFIGDNQDVAEILVMDKEGRHVKGKVTGEKCVLPAQAFDDNVLSNSTLSGNLDVDFGEPVAIDGVIVVPRGDGNGVFPKYQYELFYLDKNGWVSLGCKTASEMYLEYENVPSGALYWLRNRSTGVEERIFTYENGRVTFW